MEVRKKCKKKVRDRRSDSRRSKEEAQDDCEGRFQQNGCPQGKGGDGYKVEKTLDCDKNGSEVGDTDQGDPGIFLNIGGYFNRGERV